MSWPYYKYLYDSVIAQYMGRNYPFFNSEDDEWIAYFNPDTQYYYLYRNRNFHSSYIKLSEITKNIHLKVWKSEK